MKKIIFTPLVICVLIVSCKKDKPVTPKPAPAPAPVTPVPVTPSPFEEAWKDDFNGTQLDTAVWYHRGLGVRKGGFNDTTGVSVHDGNLYIKVYSDTIGGVVKHHTGMLATKTQYKYGKFEARISFANKSGSWSAFWLQSPKMGNPVGDPQNAGMEIDVVESLPNDGRAYHNLHWDGYGADHKAVGTTSGVMGINGGDYHIFTVEWTPEYYKFYVDNILTWTYTKVVSQRSEYMMLSSEVENNPAGTWAGPIAAGGYGSQNTSTTVMKVDYVKWYKMN